MITGEKALSLIASICLSLSIQEGTVRFAFVSFQGHFGDYIVDHTKTKLFGRAFECG